MQNIQPGRNRECNYAIHAPVTGSSISTDDTAKAGYNYMPRKQNSPFSAAIAALLGRS